MYSIYKSSTECILHLRRLTGSKPEIWRAENCFDLKAIEHINMIFIWLTWQISRTTRRRIGEGLILLLTWESFLRSLVLRISPFNKHLGLRKFVICSNLGNCLLFKQVHKQFTSIFLMKVHLDHYICVVDAKHCVLLFIKILAFYACMSFTKPSSLQILSGLKWLPTYSTVRKSCI